MLRFPLTARVGSSLLPWLRLFCPPACVCDRPLSPSDASHDTPRISSPPSHPTRTPCLSPADPTARLRPSNRQKIRTTSRNSPTTSNSKSMKPSLQPGPPETLSSGPPQNAASQSSPPLKAPLDSHPHSNPPSPPREGWKTALSPHATGSDGSTAGSGAGKCAKTGSLSALR